MSDSLCLQSCRISRHMTSKGNLLLPKEQKHFLQISQDITDHRNEGNVYMWIHLNLALSFCLNICYLVAGIQRCHLSYHHLQVFLKLVLQVFNLQLFRLTRTAIMFILYTSEHTVDVNRKKGYIQKNWKQDN